MRGFFTLQHAEVDSSFASHSTFTVASTGLYLQNRGMTSFVIAVELGVGGVGSQGGKYSLRSISSQLGVSCILLVFVSIELREALGKCLLPQHFGYV